MSSADSMQSDIPSTYSYFSDGSEGDIQCTLTKSNTSNESENDPVSAQETSTDWQAPNFSEEERQQVIEECKHLSEESPVIFPCDARRILQNNHPIEDRMRLIPVSLLFVSTFMGGFLDIEMQKPKHRSILLDVCAFSISKPIVVLSFSKCKDSSVIKYNSRIARSIMMRINEDLGTNLACIHGIIEEADFQSDEKFIKRMEVVENDVKQFAVAVTLHMDRQKCSDAVKSFLKLIPQMSPKQNASGSTYGGGVKAIQPETKEVTVQNRKDFRAVDDPKPSSQKVISPPFLSHKLLFDESLPDKGHSGSLGSAYQSNDKHSHRNQATMTDETILKCLEQPSMSLTDRASQTDEKMSHIENAKSVIKRQKTTLKYVYSRFALYLNKNRAKESFDVNKSKVTDLELREVVDETTGILSNLNKTIDLFSAEEKNRAECNIYDLVKNIIDDKNEMKKKLEQLRPTQDAEEKESDMHACLEIEDKGQKPKTTAHNTDSQVNSPSPKISETRLKRRKQQTFAKDRSQNHKLDVRTNGYLQYTQSQLNRLRGATKPSPTHVRLSSLRCDWSRDSRPSSVNSVGHAVSSSKSNSPTSDVSYHRQNIYHRRLTPKRRVQTNNLVTPGTKLITLEI